MLLQCVDVSGVDLAGKPPDQCLWQLPAQLLHTSWASKCGCHTTETLTSGRMEVSLLSPLNRLCDHIVALYSVIIIIVGSVMSLSVLL